jgi:hypothetical protein
MPTASSSSPAVAAICARLVGEVAYTKRASWRTRRSIIASVGMLIAAAQRWTRGSPAARPAHSDLIVVPIQHP